MTGDPSARGIDGGLIPRRGETPAEMAPVHGYVCTVDVDNLDAHVAKLSSCGGTVTLPKFPIPTVGWLAYGKDTEGNIFGMMQADAKCQVEKSSTVDRFASAARSARRGIRRECQTH